MSVMASKTVKTLALATALATTLSATRPAQASGCWSATEASALKVRQMQIFLMVSALQCTVRGDTQLRAAYNRFAKNSSGEMQANAALLKARFVADHGTGGAAQFDQYLTRLANNFSADPSAASDCGRLASVADEAATQNAAGLTSLAARLFPDRDRTLSCTAPSQLAGLKAE